MLIDIKKKNKEGDCINEVLYEKNLCFITEEMMWQQKINIKRKRIPNLIGFGLC